MQQRIEDLCPDPFPEPTDKAIVQGFPWFKDNRRIDPATARLQDTNDPADHSPIINTGLAPRIGRQKRLQP